MFVYGSPLWYGAKLMPMSVMAESPTAIEKRWPEKWLLLLKIAYS